MLGIDILCVGKLNTRFLKEGCDEYMKRLGAFAKVTVTELAETRLLGEGDAYAQKVIEDEGARILAVLQKRKGAVVALCVEGKKLSSEGLAAYLEKTAGSQPSVTFVIGGSLGLSDAVKAKADLRMSMSDMTFPHQLARLMLFEQVYRAMTINNNVKYHK